MLYTRLFSFIFSMSLIGSCAIPKKQEKKLFSDDPHSFSKPNISLVSHLELEIAVDFSEKKLFGKAKWTLNTVGKEIIFDTYDLAIKKVYDENGKNIPFSLGEKQGFLGSPLKIEANRSKNITIEYETGKDARALQWLSSKQTLEKKSPFLFTQSQAILARSWVPCQDSPGIRFTYSAEVIVPPNMMALMSAEGNPEKKNEKGKYTFHMDKPIPSYLLALSVGELSFKSISERVGVYAEQGLLEKSVKEFEDVEQMMIEAEKLYGKYQWGRYDILILPPSFPFGGMENPLLTFATPTIITGDKSLVALIAHELAHSWSGNLVTNATWSDFWLNEGFTTYFELRIMEAVYGKDYSEMLALLGKTSLDAEINELMLSNPDATKLKLNLKNVDPDEAINAIAYEKGYSLLRYLEESVGRKKWDDFLKSYFSENKFTSIDTETFLELLKKKLFTDDNYKKLGIEQWVYETGLPKTSPTISSLSFSRVEKIAKDVLEEKSIEKMQPETKKWSTHEWLHFLNFINEEISLEKVKKLDKVFNLTESGNSEVLAVWFKISIKTNYSEAEQALKKFLLSVGRRKFIEPLYKTLVEEGKKEFAKKTFLEAKENYHSLAISSIKKLF